MTQPPVPQQAAYPATATGQFPVVQPVTAPPLTYSPPPPSPPPPVSSFWRERMPFGPVPLILTAVGTLLIVIGYLGPAAIYADDKTAYKEIWEIPVNGLSRGYQYGGVAGIDLLPLYLALALLAATLAVRGRARVGLKVGTLLAGLVAIASIVGSILSWRSYLLGTQHYYTGNAPEPSPSDSYGSGDDPDEYLGDTVSFGWGTILLVLGILIVMTAAAVTFDPKAAAPAAVASPGPPPSPVVAHQQPGYPAPTPAPAPPPGQWQQHPQQ
ncbi:hypothetical protein Afil01_56890 [Actinorhabdospora filicis]|uniref:Uncharacterized protein n=1 Tax=Actinorhabdospora filicis TaxID=1785913 RepID=A0A9W6SS84_9ACTN|nr:hypothetical protein [Actinorhabdospora filicis]GLZ80882.1 hypothetical protein Afil01_56890 [Actinorhabdospora filicis]